MSNHAIDVRRAAVRAGVNECNRLLPEAYIVLAAIAASRTPRRGFIRNTR
jgi:hypothetical protein